MNLENITLEIKDGIYYIGFGKYEKKSLTVISEGTLKELDEVFTQADGDKNAKGMILFSHKENFLIE